MKVYIYTLNQGIFLTFLPCINNENKNVILYAVDKTSAKITNMLQTFTSFLYKEHFFHALNMFFYIVL
jgi:hypothetical protein